MADVTVEWDDADETIVRVTFVGRFAWEEFFAAQAQANVLIAGKSYRCDLIADLSRGRSTNAAPALMNAKKVLETSPDNLGLFVVITSTLANIIITALKRLDPALAARVLTATRLEQARSLVAMSREQA